jgi:TRAP-type C4-dicarboxylate transport system permease large subunit
MSRLPGRTFYGIIIAGLLLGVAAAAASAWAYRESGGRHAEGKRVLAGVADELVLPVAVMAGATFGGLTGFAAAVLIERWATKPQG